MSVHKDVCGSVTLYREGDGMVLPTTESRSTGGMISYEPELVRSVYRLSFS